MRMYASFDEMKQALGLDDSDVELDAYGQMNFAGTEADWGIYRGAGWGHPQQESSRRDRSTGWLITTARTSRESNIAWILGYEVGANDRREGRVVVFGDGQPIDYDRVEALHQQASQQAWWQSRRPGEEEVNVEEHLAPWLDEKLKRH